MEAMTDSYRLRWRAASQRRDLQCVQKGTECHDACRRYQHRSSAGLPDRGSLLYRGRRCCRGYLHRLSYYSDPLPSHRFESWSYHHRVHDSVLDDDCTFWSLCLCISIDLGLCSRQRSSILRILLSCKPFITARPMTKINWHRFPANRTIRYTQRCTSLSTLFASSPSLLLSSVSSTSATLPPLMLSYRSRPWACICPTLCP